MTTKKLYPHLYEYEILGRKTTEGKDYLANHYELVLYEVGLQISFLTYRAENWGGTKKIHFFNE
jgi:hypothetical protein